MSNSRMRIRTTALTIGALILLLATLPAQVAKHPEARYQSVPELRRALEALPSPAVETGVHEVGR